MRNNRRKDLRVLEFEVVINLGWSGIMEGLWILKGLEDV